MTYSFSLTRRPRNFLLVSPPPFYSSDQEILLVTLEFSWIRRPGDSLSDLVILFDQETRRLSPGTPPPFYSTNQEILLVTLEFSWMRRPGDSHTDLVIPFDQETRRLSPGTPPQKKNNFYFN